MDSSWLVDPQGYATALNEAANKIAEYQFFRPRNSEGDSPSPLRERAYSADSSAQDSAGFLIIQAHKLGLFSKHPRIETEITEQLGQSYPPSSRRVLGVLVRFLTNPNEFAAGRTYAGDAAIVRKVAGMLGNSEPDTVARRRHAKRGSAQEKLRAALLHHHEYENGSVGKREPIGTRALAKLADCSPSAAKRFFDKQFGGDAEYERQCANGKIIEALKLLAGDVPPSLLSRELVDG